MPDTRPADETASVDIDLPDEKLEQFYYQIKLVRSFEERLFELFGQGELFGTTHACIGQEADAVAVATINGLDVLTVGVAMSQTCRSGVYP